MLAKPEISPLRGYATAVEMTGVSEASTPVISTEVTEGDVMERSPAREPRDFSAPWLRRSGRNDRCFRSINPVISTETSTPVISTEVTEGDVMERSPAREPRDFSASWLRHSGRNDRCFPKRR